MKQLLKTIPAFLLLCILFVSTAFSQKKQTPKTLLWKISGNGLTETSYLYGAHYITDKEIFSIGDSVYAAIKNSAGYVTEMNMDSMSYAVSRLMEFKREKLISGILNKDDFQALSAKMERITGKSALKVTEQDLFEYSDTWIQKEMFGGGNKMNTFVHAYFYKHALSMNKWIGGIEGVEDHLNIIRQPMTSERVHYIVSEKFKNPTYDYLLKEAYLKQDLNLLDSLINTKPPGMQNDFIAERNINMAERINQISRQKNSFFIVDVSHLTGEDGLIKLLSKKGFSIDPVFSNQYIQVDQYNYDENSTSWNTYHDEDDLYKISLPGKPASVPNEDMNMVLYTDITSSLNYLIATKPMEFSEKSQDLFTAIVMQHLKANEILKENDIVNQNINGKEIFSIENDLYNRIQVFAQPGGVVWVMVIAPTKEQLNSDEVEKFFQSLQLIVPEVLIIDSLDG